MSTERQTFVEIDLPVCSLVYGESPCTAVLNGGDPDDFGIAANNTRKCYNTRSTCQDLPNIHEQDKVLRLAVATLNLDPGIQAIPSIVDVSYTPPRINLAQGLGERSVVKITAQDHPFPDTGPAGDKYLDDRDFDAFGLGTFWGKFRTRYPFMRGRTLRWKTGIVGTTIDNMETREFVIDRIDGPDVSGRVVITAKDPVSFLDDQRSLTPRLSRGLVATLYSETSTDPLVVTPADAFDDYPNSGFVAVGGNEVMQYTSKTAPVGAQFTLVIGDRARFGTTAVEHDVEDRVQLCRVLDDGSGGAIRADEFLVKLLTEDDFGNADSGSIKAQFIREANWQFEAETFLAPGGEPRQYSGIITEPEPIADIVNEFCESVGGSIWWNDLEQRLEFQTLRAVPVDSNDRYGDDIILADTFQQRTMERDRLSRVWVFYAPLDALEQTEDKNNYLQAFVNISALSEEQYGTASVREIFSRFIRGGSRPAAERVAQFLLSRYALPPRNFVFVLPRDDDEFISPPVLGQNVLIESRFIQDDIGQPQVVEAQIIGVVPSATSWTVEAQEVSRSDIEPPGEIGIEFVIPVSSDVTTGLNLSEVIRNARRTPFSPGDTIRIVVESGVVVTNTRGGPALATGDDLPSVTAIIVDLRAGAIIEGQGGRGGAARSDLGRTTSEQGEAGGTAIVATQGIQIEMDPASTIAGGGGGGAGGAGAGEISLAAAIKSLDVAASGGGGQAFGQAGRAAARARILIGFISEGLSRVQQGSRAGKSSPGSGATASRSASIRIFPFSTSRTVTVTSGAGGAAGQPGQGSTVSGANTSSSVHSQGGAAGFSIKGDANITFIGPEATILGPRQANP